MYKKRRRKKYTETSKCLECGNEFTMHREWQKFCGERCRYNHFMKRRINIIKKYNEDIQDKIKINLPNLDQITDKKE
jgi:DNA-directed RNA polymerase subunit RPC12/RpoP